MRELQITCIKKIPRFAKNENVKYIGNSEENWRRGLDDIISRIEWGKEGYYVINPETGRKSSVDIIREEWKAPYIRAISNNIWNDDLLLLSECDEKIRLL